MTCRRGAAIRTLPARSHRLLRRMSMNFNLRRLSFTPPMRRRPRLIGSSSSLPPCSSSTATTSLKITPVPLVLSCCSSRLATWSASVGCSLVTTRTGDGERGRLHPPTRAGLCRSATRGREGGPGGGCVGGLRHPAYTLARTPLGRLLIAVGRAAPLSVAWLPLAGFLLPSSPLPQVAESVGAGDVIGGSWSSILFSLDVAVGLWPLLREGLRSSRLRPGALTRPCAS